MSYDYSRSCRVLQKKSEKKINMKQAVRVAEAQEIILHDVQPSGVEKIALLSALRRVMAEDVVASRHIPPHDNSAMDGYAVWHRDVAGATSERPARRRKIFDRSHMCRITTRNTGRL